MRLTKRDSHTWSVLFSAVPGELHPGIGRSVCVGFLMVKRYCAEWHVGLENYHSIITVNERTTKQLS